jgi:hypothetical protein
MSELDKYLNYKLIESVANDELVLERLKKYDDLILNREFIIILGVYMIDEVQTNHLDEEQLDNLSQLVNYIKLSDKLPKKIYTPILNDMICDINSSNGSNIYEYYMDNYFSRFHGHGILKGMIDHSNYLETIKKIKKSISKDYFCLYSLTKAHPTNFYYSFGKFVSDEYFLLSVNQIVHEFPEIFNDKTFLRRLKIIIDYNINALYKIENKEKRKIIEKRSKYYAKRIK